MFSDLPNLFGVASSAGSWEGVYGQGDRISTHIFLPETEEEADATHWNIFSDTRPKLERRCLVYLLIETEGRGLDEAESTYDLLRDISHAMLGTHRIFPIVSPGV